MPREPSPSRPSLPSLVSVHRKIAAGDTLNPLEDFIYWQYGSPEFPRRLADMLDWYVDQCFCEVKQ